MFGRHGIIGLFVRHRNASNLLMAIMLIAGLFALTRLNTQFFPTIGLDFISVSVVWPGATATDVESNIVAAVEPEVRFLDSVKRVFSFAREGVATVVMEYEAGTEMQTALSNVEAAIGRVATLPEDSETPRITRVVAYDPISRLLISGPFSEASLKAIAKGIRDDLLAAGIDQVSLFGTRDDEIWVEVPASALRRMNLTLTEIAQRIGASSQDLPSGTIEGDFEKQIRSVGLATTAESVGAIEVRSLDNGEKVYLRDIAGISESFKQQGRLGLRDGHPAVELFIQRSTNADALEVAGIVNDYLDETLPTLPQELRVEHFDVQASLIRERINLLLFNGAGGLILVLAVLFVFLSGRVAFWVAVGIPTAMMATLAVMLLTGQTINMVSLFALIMTLGIIVDDAIVVGEHAASRRAAGMGVIEAAETGARRMLPPVMSSSLTTIAAFLPIAMIGDIIGQVVIAIPFVVVAVLIASLVECFWVLPGHLREALPRPGEKPRGFRRAFDERFARFRDGRFRRAVTAAVEWRYLTIAGAVGILIVSGGVYTGGRLTFEFFPSPEPETINANVTFAPGTPRARTEDMIREMERALRVTEDRLTNGEGGLVIMSFGKVGASQGDQFSTVSGDHLGGLHVELVPGDKREILLADFVDAWRAEIRDHPGIERISMNPRLGGPPGRELDIRMSGGSVETLKEAALEVAALLRRVPGVSDVEDDLPYGKQEVILSVTPRGAALGFTTESVGRQVRSAFEGVIAKRFPRGDEEVVVRVQYPRGAASAADLEDLYLRASGGAEVPLSEVVAISETDGFARIRREDGARQVAIVAEVDEEVTNAGAIIESLRRPGGVPDIADRFGLSYSFEGRAAEQGLALRDVRNGALIGLAAIYIILAWVFGSYSQPVVIMAIIPFGIIGAIAGHMVMGFNLTMLSLVSLLGLSGILVNNSIILVSVINERRHNGEDVFAAIIGGAQDRLRAVLLTSLTTIGGLLPLMFETSLQAQFMIPMAVTIVFGLMVATVLVLIVVPALMGILDDVGRLLRRPGEVLPATGAD